MLSPRFFIESLKTKHIDFFAGVPDSLLKSMCAYIADNIDSEHNIIAANEGGAIGLAAGYHLATGKIPVVYMQNSGEGNAINPLASLVDKEVYNIPILLIIGWRGEPNVHDEPQHIKQGKITLPLLDVMNIKYSILDQEETKCEEQLQEAVGYMSTTNEPYALIVQKNTFEPYQLRYNICYDFEMSREEAVQLVADSISPTACIVSTTGMISRELFEYRDAINGDHYRDFLTVGSMGHASQIALGIALECPSRKVYCFDGDGAILMHMGSLAIIASKCPKNYIHVVFNNGAHDSVGGQPTVGLQINLTAIAKAVGYSEAYRVATRKDLLSVLTKVQSAVGPIMIEICVKKGNRKDLGRPTTTPIQNKDNLMKFLKGKK